MSPLSDDLPSNVEEEENESEGEGEGEGEGINEKEKKTKRLEHLITTHYNASKCVVLYLVCSTNTPRSVAPPVQLAHALNEIVAAHRIKEHKAQQIAHERPVHHVQRFQFQLYSSLPDARSPDSSPASGSSTSLLQTAAIPTQKAGFAPSLPRHLREDTPSPRIDSRRESREWTAASTPRRFAGRSRTSHWGTESSPCPFLASRGSDESHRSFPRQSDRGFRGFSRDLRKPAARCGREGFEAKSTRTLR